MPVFVSQFGEIEGASEFRHCCDEMRNAAISDEDFFDGDKLISLRDDALDQLAN